MMEKAEKLKIEVVSEGENGGDLEEENEGLARFLMEIRMKAQSLPPEEFFKVLDRIVETTRAHIELFDDEKTRQCLLETYRGIVRYALDCQLKAHKYH